MTIPNNLFRWRYTATAGDTTFQYTNKILVDADLAVYLNDTLKTLDTDYTVTSAGEPTGGNVVFATGLAEDDDVLITKDGVDFTQDTDYVENDSFPAEAHEDALDKLTLLCQKIWDYVRRSVKVPITSSLTDLEFPDPKAGTVIAWNGSEDGFMNVTLSGIGGISDEAYSSTTWDGVADVAPSQNAVRDKIETLAASVADAMKDDGSNLAIGSDADGDMYYRESGVLARLAKGIDSLGAVNLSPVVNASVNKLDIFSKSGGAAPDSDNPIKISIPDGTGYTQRSRAAAYLSGTSQIIMADAAGYWGRSSLADEIKTAWLYAIWDGTGIVWALGGYSGFNTVPTTTTAGDDDYFLLEDSSTYTRNAAHHCVAVAKIRYEYNTADTPDHTIQASGENAPQVIWNPESDYSGVETLATGVTSASDIADFSVVSTVVKQSGRYRIGAQINGYSLGASAQVAAKIKTGSSTYGSASIKSQTKTTTSGAGADGSLSLSTQAYLNAGDTIHLGGSVASASGNRAIIGDNTKPYITLFEFGRID